MRLTQSDHGGRSEADSCADRVLDMVGAACQDRCAAGHLVQRARPDGERGRYWKKGDMHDRYRTATRRRHQSGLRVPATRRLVAALAAALVCFAAAPVTSAIAYDADRVASLPTVGPVSPPQFAGYASAGSTSCADLLCSDRPGLFYWMFPRSKDCASQRTIVWSNGGPGSSSFYGPLTENGPYNVDPSVGLVPNPNSWTSAANYLFFDHPLGVGLSFPFHGQFARSMPQGIDQLYHALVHV